MTKNELKELKVKGLALTMEIERLNEKQKNNSVTIRSLVKDNHQMGQEKTKLTSQLFGLFKQ